MDMADECTCGSCEKEFESSAWVLTFSTVGFSALHWQP